MSLTFLQDNTIEVRISIINRVLYSDSILVPALLLSSTTPTSPTATVASKTSFIGTPWVTDGVGLGAVLLSIVAALSLVLVLKHIQTKRRQRSKGN